MAAVDVFEEEPVTGGHPLLGMENVICTPHLDYMAREQMELYYSDVFDRVLAFAAGKPVNVVNPEALRRD
jgi:D-3-phosphoglycerate dehydrogenase